MSSVFIPAWSKENQTYSWFDNSARAARCIDGKFDFINRYKEVYGYQIHYNKKIKNKNERAYVEFPNESEATMFMLIWS